ncbi:MAG: DEAD/DEAH box helicase family protein [Lentisphaeria bacterium]|nr:DEAD/DEAH box helicase family protein [Lentisphaeria bacterium]
MVVQGTPEAQAREIIDRLLESAGWAVQDRTAIDLGASLGVAVREFPMADGGEADYLFFVDRRAAGVIEAKKAGVTLSGVADQSGGYATKLPPSIPHVHLPLPFVYESTGIETRFRDNRDPEPRSRRVFAFHRPDTLARWLAEPDTLRHRLRHLPPLVTDGLYGCQVEAVTHLEESLAADRPRALIQMATGSGKTFTAVNFVYRLIQFAKARRVLFLVDRSNLGRQTLREFQQYVVPEDGRKFAELYNIQHLSSNTLDPVSRVCITTIQRLYSMLRGEEYDPELEEHSGFEMGETDGGPRDVAYNPAIPVEMFDVIVTDECHRSIYHLWRQVLEYFDAHIIGLTATPSKQTLGFFNQNLVMEYGHERAVADGVNVGYEVYRIRTRITEEGSTVEKGFYVDRRSRLDRKTRWEMLDQDLTYTGKQLDRDVVAMGQIRTIIRTFRQALFTEIFPGRTEVPKTLVFAKDDSHAEDIVQVLRDEFGRGNDFCRKITYRTYDPQAKRYEKPEDLLQSFRNSFNPRIAVTVDMISTGTDVRPLECLLFLRDVHSRIYFDQMKGRGTRTIDPTELNAVTPDCSRKTHFVIVDAVGVCESDKGDTRPLERKKSVPFDKLLLAVAMGDHTEDTLTSLAGRLARLDREIDDKDRGQIAAATGGVTLGTLVNRLLDALDPDKHLEAARATFGTDPPTPEQVTQAAAALAKTACLPFDSPELRNLLVDLKRQSEQTIDSISQDEVMSAGFDQTARDKARAVVTSFRQFIEDNRDELTALQILYTMPYGQRHLTYASIRQLAEALEKPPLLLTADRLWQAYANLEQARVRQRGPQRLLTDIISLLRFAIGEAQVLEPFAVSAEQRFQAWLAQQQAGGRAFTAEQMEWLTLIKDRIVANLDVDVEDFELAPFFEKGGPLRAAQLFGNGLRPLLRELAEVLAA